MSAKVVYGIAAVGLALALGCTIARALQPDDPVMVRLIGASELAGGGASAAEFIEGRPMHEGRTSHAIPASAGGTLMDDQEASYYRQDSLFAFLLAGIAALALAGFALINTAFAPKKAPKAKPPDAWRDQLFEMIEADLRNMDHLMQGPSRR